MNALVFIKLFPERDTCFSRQEWEDKYDCFYEAAFKKTFGGLVTQLVKSGGVSEEISCDLKHAIEIINTLAHKFFRDRDKDFFYINGRKFILEYSKSATLLFHNIGQQIDNETAHLAEKYGLSQSYFEEMHRNYLLAAKAGTY
ncbi:MAG: hypothetical protein HC843_08300 [Sphingomonadales bacterium]|nr:hypothetical protein [Sphingomonadales bacterium]